MPTHPRTRGTARPGCSSSPARPHLRVSGRPATGRVPCRPRQQEAQRIRLATQIGSRLTGVLYVLDEPSIGLHQRDNEKLIATLKKLRDLGNTLIVVEHDEDTMYAADQIVDIGPGAGVHGGNIIAQGTAEEIKLVDKSITGRYLSGKEKILVPKKRRKSNGKSIEILGATENNLKNVNVKIPLGVFNCVTGVSGSGKSTLVNEVLYKFMARELYGSHEKPGKCDKIKGLENIDKVVFVIDKFLTSKFNIFYNFKHYFRCRNQLKQDFFEKNFNFLLKNFGDLKFCLTFAIAKTMVP